ncbi:unnamed protein product, partial [Cuscuta europaea]
MMLRLEKGNEVKKEGEEKDEWRKKRKEIAEGKKKVFENNASPRSSSIFYSKVNCNSVSTKQTSSSSVLSPKLNISETSSRHRSIHNTSIAYGYSVPGPHNYECDVN